MKQFKSLFSVLLLLSIATSLRAQLVEGTPCTATCIDVNKSSITGRQPNQNGVSPNLNLPCGSGTSEDNPAWWIIRPSGNKLTFSITTSNCVAGGCGLGVQMTIWEGDNWRVFASNHHGISFEVREGLVPDAALAAWQDFRKKIGLV